MKIGKMVGAGITALAGAALLITGAVTAPQPVVPRVAPAADRAAADPSYVLREWNGQLAVFRKGSTHPEMVYEDVAVAALPVQEQERLKQGIEVSDRSALNRLLEDYTS